MSTAELGLGLSIFLANSHRRHIWIPCAMGLMLLLTQSAIGSAYGGDCGTTASSTGLLFAALGLAALNAQFIFARRDAQKQKSSIEHT